MLSDRQQADAYANFVEGLDKLESLITITEAGYSDEDWELVRKMGQNFSKVRKVLER